MAVKLFTNQSAHAYPNIEGTVLSKFVAVYLQTKEWDTACRYFSLPCLYKLDRISAYICYSILVRDDGLYSRLPTLLEAVYYELDNRDVAVFLPPAGDEDNEGEK